MRFLTDLSKGILGKPDSEEMWHEIISCIPDEIFLKKDLKILNLAFGHGTESDLIAKRMMSLGRDVQEIKDSMYLLDKYSVFTKEALRKGYKNVLKQDFEHWETEMKFDIIVGNPPYEAADTDGRKDQAKNLWSKFTKKSFDLVKDDGYVALVTPASWLSPAADVGKGESGIRFFRDYFQKLSTIKLNINECARHFNVGSTFSYFVVKNTPAAAYTTNITTEQDSYDIDLRSINFLPISMSRESISINKKVLECKDKFGIIGNNLPETKVEMSKEKTEHFSVPAYHTSSNGGKYWYVKQPIQNASCKKVIISISGNYVPVYDQGGMSFTGMCVVYYLKDNEIMDSVKSFLDSKLVKFVLKENKYTGWVSPVISDLPNVDKTKIWSDKDLYAHFNLTQEEIDYIEARS